jgi:hypothetical protein
MLFHIVLVSIISDEKIYCDLNWYSLMGNIPLSVWLFLIYFLCSWFSEVYWCFLA